jgi:hypothetical protein
LLVQGDTEGALVQYQRSIEILERLSRDDPDSHERSRNLITLLGGVADLLMEIGDVDTASAYRDARSAEIERLREVETRLGVPGYPAAAFFLPSQSPGVLEAIRRQLSGRLKRAVDACVTGDPNFDFNAYFDRSMAFAKGSHADPNTWSELAVLYGVAGRCPEPPAG